MEVAEVWLCEGLPVGFPVAGVDLEAYLTENFFLPVGSFLEGVVVGVTAIVVWRISLGSVWSVALVGLFTPLMLWLLLLLLRRFL